MVTRLREVHGAVAHGVFGHEAEGSSRYKFTVNSITRQSGGRRVNSHYVRSSTLEKEDEDDGKGDGEKEGKDEDGALKNNTIT